MPHKKMTSSELKEFKSLLLDRTRLLKGDLAGLQEETRTEATEGAAPGHTAELASDESERDLSYGRMSSQTEELREISAALERIKDGSFGKCETCEGNIPKERLRAIAYARLCVKCQTKEEQG